MSNILCMRRKTDRVLTPIRIVFRIRFWIRNTTDFSRVVDCWRVLSENVVDEFGRNVAVPIAFSIEKEEDRWTVGGNLYLGCPGFIDLHSTGSPGQHVGVALPSSEVCALSSALVVNDDSRWGMRSSGCLTGSSYNDLNWASTLLYNNWRVCIYAHR